MKKVILICALLIWSSAQAEPTLYLGFHLVDPLTRQETPDSWMLVAEGMITAVGQGTPPPEVLSEHSTIDFKDMQGAWAMPGLIDSHAHVTLGVLAWKKTRGQLSFGVEYDRSITAQNAHGLLNYGVTTIRNPGGDTVINIAYERAVDTGELVGPEAQSAGLVIDSASMDGLTVAPSTERPIELIVEEQAAAGVEWVKFYQSLSADELKRGIVAADKHGVRSIVHTGPVSWTDAAEMGVDAIVHMMPTSPDLLSPKAREAYLLKARPGTFSFFEWFEFADLDGPEIQTMIAAMARHSVHLDATLVVFEAAFWGDDTRINENPFLSDVHPAMLETWRNTFRFDLGWEESDYQRARAVWSKVLRLTRMMHEAGVPMSIGTDLGNPWVVPGRSVHQEMALHVQAGIAPWAVLQMATTNAARALGVEDRIGRIAPGFEADVLFLAGNPSKDISHTLEIIDVLNNGHLVQRFEPKEVQNH
ncbi:MAG: amidohydrolase family protein [Gammaproteobacteria bacterium]|nr:amidohydrolase family protein [Gammaproteobacteria bacterium]